MKQLGRFISLLLLAGFLSAGCSQLESPQPGPEPVSCEFVSVPVYLTVAPEEDGTPATKVDYEPDAPGYNAANAIKTLTILQFEKDAVGDGYTRVGNQVCYSWPLPDGENIALATSPRENIIFVIANATAPGEQTIPLSGSVSLDGFLRSENSNLLSTLDALDGTGIWYTPNGGSDKYLRMSATQVVPKVTLGTTLGTAGDPLELKRNCAKVTVNVKNTSSGADLVEIESVQLCDINQNYHFLTNYTGFIDPYSPMTPRRFNNAMQAFPADKNPEGGSAGATESYSFYVPANMRGTVENDAQIDKNRHAPQGATYFRIYATYGSPAKYVTYTYYLGANLTSDFNIEANRKYEFTIDIKGRDNLEMDSRFEDRGEIKFDLDANCYMLKPPVQAGATTTYSIPVRRAAVFWNRPSTNMGLYGAGEGAPEYTLTETDTWKANLVWNEVKYANGDPVDDGDLLITDSGTGFDPNNPIGQAYIQVRVTPGMRGNALVAIRKKINATEYGEIIWSWHLWVTDYDPYVQMTPIAGNYLYTVPGGEIHRYADADGKTLWVGGDYANAFIMDRNLGALVAVGNPDDYILRNGLYYEWGRKDPLPRNVVEPSVRANNTGEPEGNGLLARANIRYSVHHPAVFIPGAGTSDTSWTNYDLEGPTLGADVTWLDPRIDQHGADYCESGKSVYDPCPYGWQVPTNGTWSDFSAANTSLSTSEAKEGIYYYPEGYDPLAPKGRILYPTSGIKGYYGSGGVNDSGKNGGGRLWSDTPYLNNGHRHGYQYEFSYAGWYWNSYYHNCYGAAVAVRCVRLDYRRPY